MHVPASGIPNGRRKADNLDSLAEERCGREQDPDTAVGGDGNS
ncbi:hypothetical protein MOX01_03720 [Microbacterium oxydans]|nr:hypothetical protein MOX01_03720 [Microbacterium oxydans]